MCRDFIKYVEKESLNVSAATIDYKAMKSFLDSARHSQSDTPVDAFKLWLIDIIERGMSVSVRRRYFSKINIIYNNYCGETSVRITDLSTSLKELVEFQDTLDRKQIQVNISCIGKSIDRLMSEAKSDELLKAFMWMLFNARPDPQIAIGRLVEDEQDVMPQMRDLVEIEELHHRRKYLFSLGQGKIRPQRIASDIFRTARKHLSKIGLSLDSLSDDEIVSTLWISKARTMDVSFKTICGVFPKLPLPYSYASSLSACELDEKGRALVISKVADAFCPVKFHWYAMKLRRGVTPEDVNSRISSSCGPDTAGLDFFYPTRTVSRKVGHKLLKEVEPLIPDIAFFCTRPAYVRAIDREIKSFNLGWVFKTVNSPDGSYSAIDHRQMLMFERAIGQFSDDMKLQLTDRRPMEIGRRVHITGGVMAGYEGEIYDIKECDNGRQIYITLSSSSYLKIETHIEESLIEPLN